MKKSIALVSLVRIAECIAVLTLLSLGGQTVFAQAVGDSGASFDAVNCPSGQTRDASGNCVTGGGTQQNGVSQCAQGQFLDYAGGNPVCTATCSNGQSADYSNGLCISGGCPAGDSCTGGSTGTAGGTGTSGSGGTSNDTTFTPLAPVPGLDQGISPTQAGIVTFLNNLYKFLIGIAVILAIIMIIYGGVEYALSEVTSKASGKKKIQNALYGLVLVLAPAVVFAVINPQILNLSVNFPPLDTPWGKYNQNQTTTIQQGNDVGGQLQQAEKDCVARGGTPRRWSNPTTSDVNVTCDTSQNQPAEGSLISQSDCAKLPQYQVLQNRGYTCSNAPSSITGSMKSGGYSCSDLQGGGLCLHK